MVKLFVVEDHKIFRKMLIALLDREADFVICGEAGTGEEALELLPSAAPDLLLVDISMPGMNGFTFLQQVKVLWPKLPGIIISGHVESVYSDHAHAMNVLAYIDKAKVRDIVPRIRQALATEYKEENSD